MINSLLDNVAPEDFRVQFDLFYLYTSGRALNPINVNVFSTTYFHKGRYFVSNAFYI